MNAEIGKLARLKDMHILLTTNSLLLLGAMTWSLSVTNVFNEKTKSHAAILCALNFKYRNLPMSEVQLTKFRRVSTFVSIHNPFTLLIDLNQFIDIK